MKQERKIVVKRMRKNSKKREGRKDTFRTESLKVMYTDADGLISILFGNKIFMRNNLTFCI